MRVALVHDWLTGMRGGEKVLEVLCELLSRRRPLHAVPRPGIRVAGDRAPPDHHVVRAAPAARRERHYRRYLPLFPPAIEQFDLDGYDLVISSSHCAAKSVVTPGRARHICYCHSPMRYAWDQFDAYFGPERVGACREPLVLSPAAGQAGPLGRRDGAPRRTAFVANSQYVAGRIAPIL